MNETKIILLCNNKIALQALKTLLFFGQVAAIVIPSKNKELIAVVKEFLEESPVPLVTVDRSNFKKIITQQIEKYKAKAVLMMTFPYLIPKQLLILPPAGFINFHYGKLPEYRGPEPIFTQIMMQEKKPAVSVHVVTAGVDDGPVILQETVLYDAGDTYGKLQFKLADAGAKSVTLLMKILCFGSFIPSTAQDETKAAYHKKPTAASLMINWQTMDSHAIQALVNACNPWNKGCGAIIKNQVIGITEVEIFNNDNNYETLLPGTIINLNAENGLQVICCDNKIIGISVFYTEDGFMSGKRLSEYGISRGDRFN